MLRFPRALLRERRVGTKDTANRILLLRCHLNPRDQKPRTQNSVQNFTMGRLFSSELELREQTHELADAGERHRDPPEVREPNSVARQMYKTPEKNASQG